MAMPRCRIFALALTVGQVMGFGAPSGCPRPEDGTCYTDYVANISACVRPTFCALNEAWAANTSSYYAEYYYYNSTRTRDEAWLHLTNGATWFASSGFEMIRPGYDSEFGMGHVRLLTNPALGVDSQLELIMSADPMTDTNPKGSFQAIFQKLCAGMATLLPVFGIAPIHVSLEDLGSGTYHMVWRGNVCGPAKEHADNIAGMFGSGVFYPTMQYHEAWFAGTD